MEGFQRWDNFESDLYSLRLRAGGYPTALSEIADKLQLKIERFKEESGESEIFITVRRSFDVEIDSDGKVVESSIRPENSYWINVPI